MPLMYVNEVVDFDSNTDTYDVLEHFASPLPLPYVVGINQKLHWLDQSTGTWIVEFPHLVSFALKAGGEIDMEVLPDPDEMERLLAFGECVGQSTDPPITLRLVSWIGGPAWKLLDMYARNGFGRLDQQFLKAYYGGDRDELQERCAKCYSTSSPPSGPITLPDGVPQAGT